MAVYLEHFGLSQAPFGLTPNTGLYQALLPHDEAIQVLQTALKSGEGFIKVSGEVGTGKTLLCRKLLNEMSDEYQFAYLPNPCLSAEQIHAALANELGLKVDPSASSHSLLEQIHHCLIELASQQRPVVLLIDEAQALSDEALEVIRLLGNLETEQRKLLHVVLFGQPELDERLASQQLRQLRQRITFSYRLRALEKDEVASYIQHRLHLSGYRGGPLFTAGSLKLLTRASRGIPRLINILAHKVLMLCYGQGAQQVSVNMVKTAVQDTEDAALPAAKTALLVLGFSACFLLGLVIWWGALR
ncbi:MULTISPECIES: ExeA family protein [unclassified Agarivorans]|uniref:ExeA family protein n=1 Tax=unclassified Agarivorans TaxID=2636026 RepID=UPI0010F3D05B|nr:MULTISPECIES: AAA family ATPase [unclassified Agarivorans]MDO6764620.1 AAA family ATPase [Agarivorans sp. 1_MG-2023]GDY26472.1 general secretion pathway protein GspA [Agarivorans sp. Toyoura001]